MMIPHVVQTEADKVFVNVLNVQASATVNGAALQWDITSPDGVRVTQPTAANLGLFVGLSDGVIAASAYGLAQVYGYRSVAYFSSDSVTNTAGDVLVPVAAADYLTPSVLGGSAVWTVANNSFIYAAEAAASTGTTQNIKVFLRAL